MALLTRKQVAEFFERNLYRTVGVRAESDSCPLATFVQETHPNLIDVHVNTDNLTYINARTGEARAVTLPKWARKFVDMIDRVEGEVEIEVEDYSYYETVPVYDENGVVVDYEEEFVEDYEYIENVNNDVYGEDALWTLREATNFHV